MPGIGVVLNPFSKKYKINPHKLDQMAFIIGDQASYKPTEDLEDVYRVADEFKSRDIELIAISGGDGTIHCTLSAFIQVYGDKPLPKVTFLRGGTLNTIADTLGIRGTTERLLSNLLTRYGQGGEGAFEERQLRLTKINDSYGCIFGLGIVYRFMKYYYDNPFLNRFVAAMSLANVLGSVLINGQIARRMAAPFDADVVVNGKTWDFANYTALFSGSIRQLGLDFNLFHHMLKQNEKFHAMGMSMSGRQILPHIKKFHDGVPVGSPNVLEDLADHMVIDLKEPMPYTIDGDLLEPCKHFELSVGPELTVMV